MTALVDVKVEVFFDMTDVTPAVFFTLDSDVLDGVGILGGPVPVDITQYTYSVSVSRGRSRALDDMETGTCSVRVRNHAGYFLPTELSDVRIFDEFGEPLLDGAGRPLFTELGVFGYGNIKPGRRVRISAAGVVVFDGHVDDWNYSFGSDLSADAGFVAVDDLAILARQSFTEWTTSEGQTSGARLTDVLDRAEVAYPAAGRDIDEGLSLLQGDYVSHGSNVRDYATLIADSELGRLFVSRLGALTFQSRHRVANPVSVLTVTDNGTGTAAMSGVGVSSSTEQFYTRVSVDRETGIAQTVNAASQEEFGVRTLSITGLLLSTDEQSFQMATFLANNYSTPVARLSSMSIILDPLSPVNQALIASLDLGQAITATWTPRGALEPVTAKHIVEGIDHDHDVDGLHIVRLSLSPGPLLSVFVLDDAVLGVLDSSAVLAF